MKQERINREVLGNKHAAHGQIIVSQAATQLQTKYVLCTEGSEEQIELLQQDRSGIKVAQYMTELPSKALLQCQLQKSLDAARERWNTRPKDDDTE